ncbi:MAG: penicillin-binding protein 1C [Chitinophagales bacterium]
MSSRSNKSILKKKEYGLQLVFLLLLAFLVIDTRSPIPTNVSYSKVVLDNKNNFLHAYLSNDDKWRLYTEVNEITPELIQSIRVKEDRFFFYHPGVNPIAVVRAAVNNFRKGYRTSGASTITMQVVRLLHPRSRKISSKIIEMINAFQLEWHYSKKEILQLYINLLPYGGNIEGIKSASLLYYNKFPQHLSLSEIALLSTIPNNPEKYKVGRDNDILKLKRDQLLHYFDQRKTFSHVIIEDALTEEVTAQRREFQKFAPHFCNYVIKNAHENNILTTLNKQFQAQVESLSKAYIKQLKYKDIHNLSVLVIDNHNQNILAYLGSQDFNDADYAGQVDGTNALRSPGSTLKPLIYALAFDKGLFTPKSVLSDLPINFDGYEPENYDEEYNGLVTIEDALANSLNVPAVKVLNTLSVEEFTSTLSEADFAWIQQNKKTLGLSLALGGCGVTLQELTGLYVAFANDGNWQPLQFLKDHDNRTEKHQIISKASDFMLYEILTQITRPDLPNEFANAKNLPKIAWKTGTSYGRRDAWSIGYNKNITVGVWAGNFSGKGVPDLSGAEIATPLMIDIFNALDYDQSESGFRMPDSLALRYVCKVSGKVPNDFCNNQILDYYIPQISSQIKCDHLKKVWVNNANTISYCSYCLPNETVMEKLYPNLAGDLITFYEKQNIPYSKIPPHNPNCSHLFADHPPKITQPSDGAIYYIDTVANEKILFKADAHNDVKELFWYINDQLVGSSAINEQLFFTLPEGNVEITCTDDKGRAGKIKIEVTYL